MRIAIDTLGCKANRYDSVVIEEAIKRGTNKVVSFDQPADVYIVNSCTVTKSADAQTRQLVRRFQRMNPDAIVVVTGCSAQMNPDMYAAMPGVHYVVGSDQKGTIASLIAHAKPTSTSINVVRRKDSGFATTPIKRYADWSRAFIKIQEGCDNFCTFCIIPYSRGRSRSQRPLDVIEQIKVLVDGGYKEVVLTGIDLMSYGDCVDEEVSLDKLVERILSETSISRLRISSIEPNPLTNRLIQLAKDSPNLCPHFHLSIQSCDDAVLEKMRRRYRLKEILETFKTIEKFLPDAFVGIDLIAGFPGETDEAHKTTLKVLEENPWSELHVFPFSEREGTAATHFKETVAHAVRQTRAEELRKLSDERFRAYQSSFVGKILQVLPEKYHGTDGVFRKAISRNYLSVLVPKQSLSDQREEPVRVTHEKDGFIFADLLPP